MLVYLLTVAAIAIGGAVAARLALRGSAASRRLRVAPQRLIAEAPESEDIRIRGRVEVFEDTLTAPLSGRACVFFDARASEEEASLLEGFVQPVLRESTGTPFVVRDGTGRAIVDPASADISIGDDLESRAESFRDASPDEQALLGRHGKTGAGGRIYHLVFREARIEVGDEVEVAGRAVREPDPDAVASSSGYRGAPATRLRLTGSPAFPLQITDRLDDV